MKSLNGIPFLFHVFYHVMMNALLICLAGNEQDIFKVCIMRFFSSFSFLCKCMMEGVRIITQPITSIGFEAFDYTCSGLRFAALIGGHIVLDDAKPRLFF